MVESRTLVGVGTRHLPPGAILQERYLRGCSQCCRLCVSSCPLFPVPLVSHLHKRTAVAWPLNITSTTTYITLLHLTLDTSTTTDIITSTSTYITLLHLTLLHFLQLNLLMSSLQSLAISGIFLMYFCFPITCTLSM